MKETKTIDMTNKAVEPEIVENEKPYEFRELSSRDIFLMTKVIGKIGINKFSKCFEDETVLETFSKMSQEGKIDDKKITIIGIAAILEIANVIISNLDNCEEEIYKLLSQTSNLSVDEIKKLGATVFFEMIVDFIKKPEFKDFMKVVSKLFK